ASNGALYVIDNVLVPPGIIAGNQTGNQTDGNQTDGNQTGGNQTGGNQTGGNQTIVNQIIVNQNITQTIQSQTNLNIFVNAVQIANLNQTLSESGPYTVFVPSNEAFNRLPAATQNELMNNTTLLRQILSYHVVSGNLTLEQLINTNNVTNIQGNVLQINTVGNNLTIQNVNITQIIIVNNGVICIIDGVLVPPGTVIGGNQTDGNQTGGTPPVANQTRGNDTGTWHFFSIPFQANNTSANNLLAGVNYTSLLSYNASTGRFVNATTIEPLRGYWINVPNGTQFNASQQFGSVEKRLVTVPPSLRIYPGWNALGSPVNQTVPAEAAFIAIDNWYAKVVGPWVPGNNTTGYYQNVGYNGMNGTIASNQLGTDTFEVRPYEGYWVFIRQNNLYA
ncbi:MAG: fasciclin domain-containing protein, partial [Methanosarcina sp.]